MKFLKHLITMLLLQGILHSIVMGQNLYFPPLVGSQWNAVTPASLGWCDAYIPTLETFLDTTNTKAFIILKDGKIVHEKYFGAFTVDSLWYWASAGKSLSSLLIGIAQQQGLLSITDSTSKYLGSGWSALAPVQEQQITIWHHLTMTTGLNDNVSNPDCTDDTCLQYLAPVGTRWAYHNGAYTLTHSILENATGTTINSYTSNQLTAKTGIAGLWYSTGYNEIFASKARSAARFGLLMLARGVWNSDSIIKDTVFFNQMINTSQTINNSYGMLWWLNGKNSFMLPGLQLQFPGMLVPAAPADMYCALGKNDQKIYVVPSQGLVVVRLGNAAGISNWALSSFDNQLWTHLNTLICNGTAVPQYKETLAAIMPNPAGQYITLPMAPLTITIYDNYGRIVKSEWTPSHTYMVSDIPNGIYYIRLCSDHNTATQRLVVLH